MVSGKVEGRGKEGQREEEGQNVRIHSAEYWVVA